MNAAGSLRGRVWLLDAVTVLVIFVLALIFARPLLEEWGLAVYFEHAGLTSYVDLAKAFPLRPLQAAPSAWQWALGGGARSASRSASGCC